MELLYLFEKIRNPFLDFVFQWITHLGDETALIVIAITLFWCVNKRTGYYMLISGFFSLLTNQVLKLACKIPRPWVRDPDFTIVESAREAATGYSFPSGHTSNAFSVFGAIFMSTKMKWLKITAATLAVLVGISRMYLGVHTPWDVLAGACCPIIFLLIFEDIFKRDDLYEKLMPYIIALVCIGSVAFYLYAAVFTEQTGEANITSAVKNAGTLVGCSAGLLVVYPLEKRFIKFETKASWYGQAFKLIVGFAIVLALKSLLKSPLTAILGENLERPVRYFILILFGAAGWPSLFKYIAKVKIPALDRFGEWVKKLFSKKEKAA